MAQTPNTYEDKLNYRQLSLADQVLSNDCLDLFTSLIKVSTNEIDNYIDLFDFNYNSNFIKNTISIIQNVNNDNDITSIIGTDQIYLQQFLLNKSIKPTATNNKVWRDLFSTKDFIYYYYSLFNLTYDEVYLLNSNNINSCDMQYNEFDKIANNASLYEIITKPRVVILDGTLLKNMSLYTIKKMKTKVIIIFNLIVENYLELMSSMFTFMSRDVEKQLIKTSAVNNITKYKVQYGNDYTHIYVNDSTKLVITTNLSEIIKHQKIIKQISKLPEFSLIENISPIAFYFITTNAKKHFPNNFVDSFNSDIINSAEFTPYNVNGDTINQLKIFRFEEFFKLLFHELGHCYNIDKFFTNTNILQNYAFISSTNKVLITEIISETIANVLNIIYVSTKFDYSRQKCKIFYNLEILFGIFQTAKILYLAKFNTITEFIFKTTDNNIKQETAAVEYHILKTLCLIYFDNFLNIMFTKDLTAFTSFINEKITEPQYSSCVDYFIKHFKENYKEHYNNTLYNTSRMTIIEQRLL